MPKAEIVLWSATVALLIIMLGIIGYLIRTGFDSLKASIEKEFKIIWEKIDRHQIQADTNAAAIQEHKAVEQERRLACEERHRRVDSELVRLSLEVQQKD